MLSARARILVVLPNWFGETLFATPLLRLLREQRPHAHLATLGWPACREMLLHNPRINEILEYDERGLHRSLPAKGRLIATLRAQRFDAALILRKSLSRSLLLAMAGIPVRIGFANPKSGWLLTHRVPPSPVAMHKASTDLLLLEAVGLLTAAVPYEYVVSEEERRAARQRLAERHALDGRPLIILHPGANWLHKRWAPQRFAALGDRLAQHDQAQIAITGGQEDTALAAAVASQMRAPALMLAGTTTVRELGAYCEQARLVVSNDTGVLHMAAAMVRPVVALYGPTDPALTGPLGDPSRTVVLHHPDCCPRIPCYEPDRPPHPGMDSITVEEVFAAASDLLLRGER
jgi:lipopolysaccharide heptosyltransferase II